MRSTYTRKKKVESEILNPKIEKKNKMIDR